MAQEVILCNRGDEHEIIEEEKAFWIKDVLVAIGVDEEIVNKGGMDLKFYLDSHEIDVWQNLENGGVEIHRKDKLIAEWKYPRLVLKKDGRNYFYEIKLNEWALPFQMNERK